MTPQSRQPPSRRPIHAYFLDEANRSGHVELPWEFQRVHHDPEHWLPGASASENFMGLLSYLACRLLCPSALKALRHRDHSAFCRPLVSHGNRHPETQQADQWECMWVQRPCMHSLPGCTKGSSSDRYWMLRIGQDMYNRPVHISLHLLVCWAFHGPPPPELIASGKPILVRHVGCKHDRARPCICPCHLLWGTHRDDSQDRVQHRTHANHARGPNNPGRLGGRPRRPAARCTQTLTHLLTASNPVYIPNYQPTTIC